MSRYRRLLLIPLLGVALMAAGVIPTGASSHREAPLISEDPVADDTDVYAFVSPDRPDTVTMVGNWIPLEEPAGGPNFYKFGQDGRYQLKSQHHTDAVKEPTANGVDGVGGFNVHSIALQVPIDRLTANGQKPSGPNDPNAVIGVWSQTERRKTKVLSTSGGAANESGNWISVSRLGMPLVNEVVIPLGQKDRFNSSVPARDAQFLSYVQNPEPAQLIPVLYPGVTVPPAPRKDLVSIFLTGIQGLNQVPNGKPAEYLRLNMAIPPSANPNPPGVLDGDTAGF